jgi:hypothetical protein
VQLFVLEGFLILHKLHVILWSCQLFLPDLCIKGRSHWSHGWHITCWLLSLFVCFEGKVMVDFEREALPTSLNGGSANLCPCEFPNPPQTPCQSLILSALSSWPLWTNSWLM